MLESESMVGNAPLGSPSRVDEHRGIATIDDLELLKKELYPSLFETKRQVEAKLSRLEAQQSRADAKLLEQATALQLQRDIRSRLSEMVKGAAQDALQLPAALQVEEGAIFAVLQAEETFYQELCVRSRPRSGS